MRDRYLEVTFRKGKPLAAYLYLPREVGVKSARTLQAAPGLLVDYSAAGSAIGIEITAPGIVTIDNINAVLNQLAHPPIAEDEFAPLRAA